MKIKHWLLAGLVLFCLPIAEAQRRAEKKIHPSDNNAIPNIWSADKANAWYAKHPWINGANFIPSSAINQLEMWQAYTFDPNTYYR